MNTFEIVEITPDPTLQQKGSSSSIQVVLRIPKHLHKIQLNDVTSSSEIAVEMHHVYLRDKEWLEQKYVPLYHFWRKLQLLTATTRKV